MYLQLRSQVFIIVVSGYFWKSLLFCFIEMAMPLSPIQFQHSCNLPGKDGLSIAWQSLWKVDDAILGVLEIIFPETYLLTISSVQSLSCVRVFATPWTAGHQASLSTTNSRSLLKLMSIESVMPFSHLILCCPLLLLPPIPPSIRVFSNESTLHMRWPRYWSFSFSVSPSSEHPGLISFRMNWLDLLAVQGTLKSLLQHHSSKASILRRSAFFTVQLSHPYMTTGKTTALTRWTFIGKVILCFWIC